MTQFMEIILLAMLAGYLVFRLWSVLGNETPEDEERRSQRPVTTVTPEPDGNVIHLPRPLEDVTPEENPASQLSVSVRSAYKQLQEQDSSFDLDNFLYGAELAYKMITQAFASGDRELLQELLAESVYQRFLHEIIQREEQGHAQETIIEEIRRIEIINIHFQDQLVIINVRYKTRQITVIKDQDGQIIHNPAAIATAVNDQWTFSRALGNQDPNWVLTSIRGESN